MYKNNLSPGCIDELLGHASNGAAKGLAQYLTPPDAARLLARPLPALRPVIVDLTCGDGALLRGASYHSRLLGCDLDGEIVRAPTALAGLLSADLTTFYPLLKSAAFKSDLFTLNPPWGLHWRRELLAGLAESSLPTVRTAFAAHDGHTAQDCIDSLPATLMLALDLAPAWGEGYILGYTATVNRLILKDGAPHGALKAHVWGAIDFNLEIDGAEIATTALYWSHSHTKGLAPASRLESGHSLEDCVTHLKDNRLTLHRGSEIRANTHQQTLDTAEVWHAAAQEYALRHAPVRHDFNIRLNPRGVIETSLNLYEERLHDGTGSTLRPDHLKLGPVRRLHSLAGRTPMQLVLQRADRRALELATAPDSPWRVQPDLLEAVRVAITLYHSQRAPLYPLNDVQRLGHLDEAEEILCRANLAGMTRTRGLAIPVFAAGQSYAVSTETVRVTRGGTKRNLVGELEQVEYTGSELAIWLTGGDGKRYLFMEDRHFAQGITLESRDSAEDKADPVATCPAERRFGLGTLVAHFVIPPVADLAALHPHEYQRNLVQVDFLQTIRGFTYRAFQREDLARLALREGGILGWETGLGKTIAMFSWAFLQVGWERQGRSLAPLQPVLLLAPGDLHDQIIESGRKFFGAEVIRLDSQATFERLKGSARVPRAKERVPLDQALEHGPRDAGALASRFYITSYTALTQNGVAEFPALAECTPAQFGVTVDEARRVFEHRGTHFANAYSLLEISPNATADVLQNRARHRLDQFAQFSESARNVAEAWETVRHFHCDKHSPEWDDLPPANRSGILNMLFRQAHAEAKASVGRVAPTSRGPRIASHDPSSPDIRCVYSPTLADLCCRSFGAIVLDEGTRIQNEDTLTAQGLERMEADYRLVMTATPIKNRLPSIFNLVCWALRIGATATPRFPYTTADKEAFTEEFMVTEANLTRMEKSGSRRKSDGKVPKRFQKLTPQVCHVHRLWKLFGAIVLRRTKQSLAGQLQIVGRVKHVLRVPMGTRQKQVYQYHLTARYQTADGKPNIGARVAALRVAAVEPASGLLKEQKT